MLARAREPLLAAGATIRATVLASPVVCSDETSARVSGKNWWEWVFIGTLAVLHIIRPSRGKAVVQDLFGGRCACCGERVSAAAPVGLEPGSPFGQSIAALVVYLHYAHAIGMERLATLMDEIFSLSISPRVGPKARPRTG